MTALHVSGFRALAVVLNAEVSTWLGQPATWLALAALCFTAFRELTAAKLGGRQADTSAESAEASHVQGLVALAGTYRAELERMQGDHDERGRRIEALQERIERLQESARAAVVEHEHQMQKLHTTVTLLRTEVNNNTTTLATQQQAHERQMATKDREIAELRNERTALAARVEVLQSEVDTLRRRIESGGAGLQGEGGK